MEILQIDPALIVVGERLRAVSPDYVALIRESIAASSLREPISVTAADAEGRHRLIAGAHRLQAVLDLGLPTIPAIPFTGTEMEAELAEIEENLIRRELSEMDRATFLARHKTIWDALHPETRGGDQRKKQKSQVGNFDEHRLTSRFTADVATRLGWSKTVIYRALARHDALSPSIRARIADTWLADNGSALDALIGPKGERTPEERQHQLLDIMLAPKGPRSVAEAARQLDHLPPQDTDEARRQRLSLLWGKTPLRLQEDVLRTKLQAEAMRPQDGFPLRRMLERLLAEADAAEGEGEARVLRAISQGRAA
jgi:ParB family transcriptional regulator, chromosome partitioning protein